MATASNGRSLRRSRVTPFGARRAARSYGALASVKEKKVKGLTYADWRVEVIMRKANADESTIARAREWFESRQRTDPDSPEELWERGTSPAKFVRGGGAFGARRAVARSYGAKPAKQPTLAMRLATLRPDFARVAQKVVDGWEQDDEGFDEELGHGGICDQVADAMAGVAARIRGAQVTDGGHDGDDHAFIVVYNAKEAHAVDIPPGVYETGGGYTWRKRKDARIEASDVVIWAVPREHIADDASRARRARRRGGRARSRSKAPRPRRGSHM